MGSMRYAVWLGFGLSMAIGGCSPAPKPTEQEVAQARANDPYMRSIDKSHAVANEQSTREDDAALH